MTAHRSLPGPMGDLARDGVRRRDLRTGGDAAVWRALCQTAASAIQRGWTEPEWVAYLSEAKTTLGRQVRIRAGKRERTNVDYHRTLAKAWAKETAYIAAHPVPTAEDIADRITAAQTFTADPAAALTDAERNVLTAATTIAAKYGTIRPALPWRTLVDLTGLTQWQVRTALDQLATAEILTVAERGRRGTQGRATLYRLPTPEALARHTCTYPKGRSVGGMLSCVGGADSEPLGGVHLCGRPAGAAPNHGPNIEEPPLMDRITVTLDPDNRLTLAGPPEVIERAVAAFGAVRTGPDTAAIPERHAAAPASKSEGNVVPLRAVRHAGRSA